MPGENINDRLTPQALLARAQGDFDPRQAVRVGQLDAVVDTDVERFELTMDGRHDVEERKTALIGILLTLRPQMIRGVRETPEELRKSAGSRPHARIKVTCPVFRGGRAMVEMTRIEDRQTT